MTTVHDLRHLYIHVPFCARRCIYCDFAIAVRAVPPIEEYLRALRADLRQYATHDWRLETLYFGGGTPSRLGGAGVAQAIAAIRDVVHLAATAEVTIEANPEDVTSDRVSQWHSAGVNRVSLGIQSFDPAVLLWMHRTHTAEQSARAVMLLRQGGIENVSVDLIFALPAVLRRDWVNDIQRAIQLDPYHISLYGLTVESHTPLARWRDRGEVAEASEESYAADFLMAHELLGRAGFTQYEVSNYARPGFRSRHNASYWSGAAYVGLGPSAHSFDGTERWWNVSQYIEWGHRLERGESIVDGREILTMANRSAERVYLGLRTDIGLEADDAELHIARPWVEAGWANMLGRTIVLTPHGWLRLDSLAASLTLAGSR